MTTINPDSGNNTGMPDPGAFARRILSLPAEDMTWILTALSRMADDKATISELKAELAEHKARRDGLGEGS